MASPNGAAHGKDDLLHHSQPQTTALRHIAASLIAAIKTFKDFRQISIVDAAAVIGNGQEPALVAVVFKGHFHLSPILILIFQTVAEDIFKDPLELTPVQTCLRLIDGGGETDRKALRFIERPLFPDIVGHVGPDVNRLPMEGNLP